ncbi:tetratricopeptide repeat protein [Streptomyces lavendulae]|uniref:tetratricopeptide repeat protein n=1 Tax=Streptomyces lavendulae TaxID=1914 RepID=UPI0033DD87B8
MDDPQWQAPTGVVRWGRMVTDRPGTGCETWGVPDIVQRPMDAAKATLESAQLMGQVNPGSGFVGNQYVMDLLQHPPQWSPSGTSPWGGLSGAAVFCDRLLTGVVASDRAYSAHGQLNVVPAYVLHHDPSFRAALAEHIDVSGGLAAVELQHLADPAVTARRNRLPSPAALLQAGQQTVPFHGREVLLERLRTWCTRGGFGAWLLHGPGGQGKTRFAHHLTGLLAADSWAVLWPHPDASPERLREIRHVTKPLLVVLDYAENRSRQLAALIEAAAEHPGTAPLKVLLLARTDGDWWNQAKNTSSLAEEYLEAAPVDLLPPLEDDPADRPPAYRAAVSALATALPQVNGCAERDWPAVAEALPTPRLDQDGYGNALTLHMTALADLLDSTTPDGSDPAGPVGRVEGGEVQQDTVEDRLLGHERRYWHKTATTRGLLPGLSEDTLEVALATAHLIGAVIREQADQTWQRLPVLADQPRDRRDAVTNWIAALYPPAAPGQPWGGLQPDRLAERHIGRVLDADPGLADTLLHGADDLQTSQLLTVYSRAAAHRVFHGRLDAHLTDLCTRNHQLAEQIITTAIQADHPAPLITALETVTTDPTTSFEDLTALHKQFPVPGGSLSHSAVLLAQTLTERHRERAEANPDDQLPGLAEALYGLCIRLAEVARVEEGLSAIQEAVRIRRELAEADPGTHLPDLVMALNYLSVHLGVMKREEEALSAVQEAVRHSRELAETDPDTHRPDLVAVLYNLSVQLGRMKRGEEAVSASQEAVRIRRELAEADPDAHLPFLAVALNHHSVLLRAVGRGEEALSAIQEAVRYLREFVRAAPDAYLRFLATALNHLSVDLREGGRGREALSAIQEAVRHFRELVETDPDTHRHGLAAALNHLSVNLREGGRGKEALSASQEAVRHFRELAETDPDTHLPNLVNALNHHSVLLGELRQDGEALSASQEAVRHFRELAETDPDTHLPNLATALNHHSIELGRAERNEEALPGVQEALRIRRKLAEADPDTHLPNLAAVLNNLAILLRAVERCEEALSAIQEAVRIRRELAKADPDSYLPKLIAVLNHLSVLLRRVGRGEEALLADQEAVRHFRLLAETDPDAYLPQLADALSRLSTEFGRAERGEEALLGVNEAVRIRRKLAEADADTHLPHLLVLLSNLSVLLGRADRGEEALSAIEEAVHHSRALTEAAPDAYQHFLSIALNNLSLRLRAVGRSEEALSASEEAARIRHRLAEGE